MVRKKVSRSRDKRECRCERGVNDGNMGEGIMMEVWKGS